MAGILTKDIEQIALDQFHNRGHVDQGILDLLIADRQIDLSGFKNKHQAKELWNNLILLSLLSPASYKEVTEYIKTTFKKLEKGNDIPDIPA